MAVKDRINIRDGYDGSSHTYYPVLIIGAGESGIAMACQLKEKLGFDQFRIFERHSGIGGTWWINRYPGVACDVPTAFYSFSFAPNYQAKRLYPSGSEFVQYLHKVAAQYKIVDKIQLHTDVSECRYLEEENEWEVTLHYLVPGTGDMSMSERRDYIAEKGAQSVYLSKEVVRAKVVISCAGVIVQPREWPDEIPGRDIFQGKVIHTARWKDDVDLKDKDVVVIGTGCSAAQVVPALFKEPYNAKSITQVMRTPPYVMPRFVEPFGPELYARYAPTFFRYFPFVGLFVRLGIHVYAETLFATVFKTGSAWTRAWLEKDTLKRVYRMVPAKYHKMMTPKYPIGCKRRIFDSDWLESMNRSNFLLTTRPLQSLDSDGVVLGPDPNLENYYTEDSKDEAQREKRVKADVIVLSNGYEATRFLHPIVVHGRDGKSLEDVWTQRGGPQAYMGTAMDGFPNFFMVVGPNTLTGHTSVILATENAIMYILKIVAPVLKGDALSAEVKKAAAVRWTEDLQRDLKKTVFADCVSWYKDENNWNSTTYPRSQVESTIRHMFPKYRDWEIKYNTKGKLKRFLRRLFTFSWPFTLAFIYFTRIASQEQREAIMQRLMLAGLIMNAQLRRFYSKVTKSLF